MDSRQLTTSLSSFQAGNAIVTEHDIIVYWKKVRGHSRQPGQDKDFNDQTDALVKAGALHGESWTFQAQPFSGSSNLPQAHHWRAPPASSHIALSSHFAADDLLTLQTANSSLRIMAAHFSH